MCIRDSFTPVGGDDGILCIPDGTGTIGNDGICLLYTSITVYGTTQGYQYIITDMEGNIIDVVLGNISGRVYFEDLYPGTRYLI